MPFEFYLQNKETKEIYGPGYTPLVEVDNEMAKWFGIEPFPDRYLAGWTDALGVRIATNQSLDQIELSLLDSWREAVDKEDEEATQLYSELIIILTWLKSFYSLHNNSGSKSEYASLDDTEWWAKRKEKNSQ